MHNKHEKQLQEDRVCQLFTYSPGAVCLCIGAGMLKGCKPPVPNPPC